MRTPTLFLSSALLVAGCYSLDGQLLCAAPPVAAPPPARAPAPTRNVIVVTVDGARWQELFEGVDVARAHLPCPVDARTLLPNIYRRVIDGGVAIGAPGHGAPVRATGPAFVSLPGYLEIFTGRTPRTCADNRCAPVEEPTVADELRARFDLAPDDVAVISSWETIARAASRAPATIAISSGRHGGATRKRLRASARLGELLDAGAVALAHPGYLDYRPDRFTAEIALEYLREKRPRFLFVGLGDTDEHAHRDDYRGYLHALRRVDDFVGRLFATLDALGDYGAHTTVLITADHGRAADFSSHGRGAPESGRVWLLAAGGALPALGFVDSASERRLADIAPTIRAWLGLPADRSVYAGSAIPELVDRVTTVAAK
jgi:hypothetical protein